MLRFEHKDLPTSARVLHSRTKSAIRIPFTNKEAELHDVFTDVNPTRSGASWVVGGSGGTQWLFSGCICDARHEEIGNVPFNPAG